MFTKHFSDTISSAEGGRPGIQALDVDPISQDEHLLKAGALKPVLALGIPGGDTSAAASGSLSHVARCCGVDNAQAVSVVASAPFLRIVILLVRMGVTCRTRRGPEWE